MQILKRFHKYLRSKSNLRLTSLFQVEGRKNMWNETERKDYKYLYLRGLPRSLNASGFKA